MVENFSPVECQKNSDCGDSEYMCCIMNECFFNANGCEITID